MNIITKVKNNIIQNNLIKKGDSVLLAFSGGSDSTAMVHILSILAKDMGFSVCAAHINHNIRPEAKSDEEFVKRFCGDLGIECFVKSADVCAFAKEKSISEELAGREIRYEFFDELCKKYSLTSIATAHNKNDSAESVMLHLIRGCGADGLCGIPVRRGNIIRPILNLSKSETEKYCEENGLEFVIDKTNFTTDYSRNKVRLEIIAAIERELNPSFTDTVTANARIFSEVSDFLGRAANDVYERVCKDKKADISELLGEHDAVIRLVIEKMFLEFSQSMEKLPVKYVDEIIDLIKSSKTSKEVHLPKQISARKEYGRLFFKKTDSNCAPYQYKLDAEDKIYIKESNVTVKLSKEDSSGKNTKNKIYFYTDDCDGFYIRNRRKGDYFYPVGMEGKKHISDLFCDMKIPSDERDKIPILFNRDKIIWVCGQRRDRRFEKGKILMSCTAERGEN